MHLRRSALHFCGLLLVLSFAAACTDDVSNGGTPVKDTHIDPVDTYRPPPPDVGSDATDKLDTAPTDTADPRDTTQEIDVDPLPTSAEFTLCILGDSEPTDPECLEMDYLDFNVIPFNSLAERRVSIENTGEVRFEVLDLDFGPTAASDTTMELAPYRLIPDPNNPNRLKRDPTPNRVRIQPGETLFIDVLAQTGPTAGFIPAESLRIHTDLEDEEENFITITIPLEGEIRACAANTASCDGLAKTGCETNTTNDVLNCGGCGNECSFLNIDAACVNSTCEMTGQCTPGFGRCDKDPLAGCSTLLSNNFDHCGACDRSCARDNADSTCDGNDCQATCHTGFADCNGDLPQDTSDGCEVNIYQDPLHCGGCGEKCTIPNAVNLCTGTGTCTFTECLPGFFDMDGNPANGCEYQCIPEPGEDRPADTTVIGYKWQDHDKNCDGLDGDASRAYFVATNGDNTNAGTREMPMRTIQAAIDRIANSSTTIDQVYVSTGTYSEQITLRAGISIYGGFSRANGWQRSASYTTTIENNSALNSGNVIAVKGANVTSARLQNFTINAGGANAVVTNTDHGASSYGVHCVNCTNLALVGNKINAGVGAPGKDGLNSTATGDNGNPGSRGGDGVDDGDNNGNAGKGGARGISSCGRHGGAGGNGAFHTNTGSRGGSGIGGTVGGAGGSGGSTGKPGFNGGSDLSGGSGGTNGAGGTNTGSISNSYWLGKSGVAGGTGNHGNGGGGGGGGGGQGCPGALPPYCVAGTGNGGGGGGAGGCGGGGGGAGASGGGSFGVFILSSANVTIENNTVKTVTGGAGGNGGKGANGGSGANGASGGTKDTTKVGRGGNGGKGGNGGPGGYGGGGAGGPSIPVVTYQSNIHGNVETANTLTFGNGGPGGTSVGNNGTAGLMKKHHNL